jgi:acetyltransferase-like isoleucine patch superfamily enzyme
MMTSMLRKLRVLLAVPENFWQMLITYLPGPAGYKLRYRYWKRRLKHLGKDVKIESGVSFQKPGSIFIDDDCWIDKDVTILAGEDHTMRPRRLIPNERFPHERGTVHIGKYVHVAPYCIISGIGGVHISDACSLSSGAKIYSLSHHYRSDEWPSDRTILFSPRVQQKRQYLIEGPVFLGRNVGLALNAVLLPGVSIEEDSFVAINSVVRSSFEENSLIAGNPAKRIGERFKSA